MKKRALSIVLSFSMMLSLMPTTAFAEDNSNLNNVVEIQNVNAEASEDAAPEESEAAETSMFTEDEGTENLTSVADEATEDLSASEEKSAGELPSAEAEAENAETPVGEETAVASSEATSAEVAINEENFPDENFRDIVITYDQNNDGVLDKEEISSVVEIKCNDSRISSLVGVEYFTELRTLDCSGNDLTEIDISENAKLVELNVRWNYNLRSLDISNNPALVSLDCGACPVKKLDLSQNTMLESLECYSCSSLISLDVSRNIALKNLNCNMDRLTVLDVSNNTELRSLDCSLNTLTSLDLSNNTCLEEFRASMLFSYEISVSQENKTFDLSTLPGNFDVSCTSNWKGGTVEGNILTLTQADGYIEYTYDCGQGFSINCELYISHEFNGEWDSDTDYHWQTCLNCGEHFQSKTHSFDWKIDKEASETEEGLAHEECSVCGYKRNVETVIAKVSAEEGIQINEANFPDGNFREVVAAFDKNEDEVLSQSEISSVVSIVCSEKEISSLKGIEYFKELRKLDCSKNSLEELDISNNYNLVSLNCYCNYWIESLDTSNNLLLTDLNCSVCPIGSMDLSKNIMLESLDCFDCGLRVLDVSRNTALKFLSYGWNGLAYLDLSNNTLLKDVGWDNGVFRYNIVVSDSDRTFDLSTLPGNFDVTKVSDLEYGVINGNILTIDEGSDMVRYKYDCGYGEPCRFGLNIKYISGSHSHTIEANNWSYDSNYHWNTCSECSAVINRAEHNFEWIIDQEATMTESGRKHEECTVCGYQRSKNTIIDKIEDKRIPIDEEHFPDDNFRDIISRGYDVDGDGKLSEDEITKTTYLNCNRSGISSLEGVEYFTSLKTLKCSNNNLTSLDISKNTALTYLDCSYNQLTSLELQNNTALTSVVCNRNQLTSLEVDENILLERLECYGNQLSVLDVSSNTTLEELSCGANQLTSLDVKNNTLLTSLECGGNKLTSLNIKSNTLLTYLSCANNELTTLDLSQNTALEELSCGDNLLKTLDLSSNVALARLYCGNGKLTSLDLSNNPALYIVYCDYNELESLTLAGNTELSWLHCNNNQLKSIDFSDSINLTELKCENNQLTMIDISKNPALTSFSCGNNQLTSLDISNNEALLEDYLSVYGNSYTINVSKTSRSFNLSLLPGNFDVNKASNWKGGTVNGSILTVDDDADTVTYTYDCGRDKTATFALKCEFAAVKEVTLVYNANGGTQEPEQISAEAGSSITLSNEIPVQEGYRFLGWALSADAVEAAYQPGDSFTLSEDTTLYAVWEQSIDGICGDTVNWNLNGSGVLTISGSGEMTNYTYRSEMPWYSYIDQIQEVVVEDGVTLIGDYAFYGMTKLTKVEIADSVKTVGEYAFKNCTALNQVRLSASLKKLGQSAFYGCTALPAIEIPEGVYTVWGYTFKNCTNLTSVSLPSTLIKLDEAAFYGCSALESLVIPNNVSIIGVYCFKNCTNLKSVVLPKSLLQVREASFYATALESLTIPDSVTTIGAYAFKNCVVLESVDMPANLAKIDDSAFYGCEAIAELTLPETLTSISSYAFRKCIGLKNVSFPESLQSIGEAAFYGCTGLSELTIPEGVTEIGAYAFKSCTGVSVVSLPSTLEEMGDSAFYGCSKLTQIVIPANVKSMGNYTFSRCSALNTIIFTGDYPTIGDYAFNGVSADAYYPAGNATWTITGLRNYGGVLEWEERTEE
ncbi:leucine-rich repeat protein [Lachnospiraceae bacterium CLA-AA-H215]|uniref:Leucine-rich repeat protein n=1 Tax=Hominifimenecus microfluidus TaxID=2885348 RepID=A0AAE3ECL5_9FIRM|nr:leucine-rich repeat protein [Hominifimenecus microfluidus]MCC2231870.1 leucine-rich repeat protein [Hominifimenecus microfluidus]